MFAPYNPNLRRQLVSAQPPADDWHAQYGGTIGDPSSLGGGGAAQPTGGDTAPGHLGSPPGVDWNQGYGSKMGGAAPDWRADLGRGLTQWDQAGQAGWQDPRIPAHTPPATQAGGGFTPLSQLARGAASQYGPDQYLGGTGYQTRWKSGAGPMPAPGAPAAMATGPTGGPGSMVLLRAPNGQTRQVPGDQVAHYLARGATRG